MRFPNFLIIGAHKAGTTSLYQYLRQHPEIYMSPMKEPHFLAYDGAGRGESNMITRLEDYLAQFAGVADETAIGEASTSYLHNPSTIERIRHHIPDARIMAVLRHPADRAYSNFLFYRLVGKEPISDFAAALEQEESRIRDGWPRFLPPLNWGYKRIGFYSEPVRQYLQAFDREHIRFYLYDDFQSDPKAMLKDVFGFLHVDEGFVPDMSVRHNISGIPKSRAVHDWTTGPKLWSPLYKALVPDKTRQQIRLSLRRLNLQSPPPIPEEVRRTLTAEYREDILKLQDLIDRDLSHWIA